ncbi:MAG: dTDP-4-dehydrorhamnose 3,5-epimerase family protein [Patescibacteria group bacterium]
MIEGVIIKKLNKNDDQRGWLAEIWRSDEAPILESGKGYKPVMSYISVTKPGKVRGPHEHVKQYDCFVFAGPGTFEIYLWDNRKKSETNGEYLKIKVGEKNQTLVVVPPGVVHGYKCVSNIDGWCVNLPNKLYRGKNKKEEVDEIRWEEEANGPYVIK